ncbi:hemerythrin domain-containing protein [Microlunatus parietis]|uniref:Hemerythrin superfamily protein n=1 Tax=Microlunatus parietis TaxID=682979 RepID=A0A7Y9L7R9_9ACTN|nr:hemerythrin domain-containing protein [Microlunatus parietis]NYE70049.1 hemerythrin superfamily protein [Microlunatus parietis]
MPDEDVVELIMNDHREVERLFEALRTRPADRPLLMPQLASLLIAHSRAEESEVYPVARDEAGETEEVAHSQEEHEQADALLGELSKLDPASAEFDSKLEELIEGVTHHVEEEESTVLPGMRERLSDARRAELAQAFSEARAAHLGDQPGGETREELVQKAQNLGVAGAGSMSKDEVKEQLPRP